MDRNWIDPVTASEDLDSESGDVVVTDCVENDVGSFILVVDAPYEANYAIKAVNRANPRWNPSRNAWVLDAEYYNALRRAVERRGFSFGITSEAKAWGGCYDFIDIDESISLPPTSMPQPTIKSDCRNLEKGDEIRINLVDGQEFEATVTLAAFHHVELDNGYDVNLHDDRVTIAPHLRRPTHVVIGVYEAS